MKVPLLDLKQQNGAVAAELRGAFTRVLNSGMFILGKEVEEFERNVAALVGARHAIGVSSGTDAILLALMTLGVGPGDEVICPSFTFFATAGCIARTGAKPVFADSCPVCFNIDVDDAARRITPRTKAIMPVHLFGQSSEMDRIVKLAEAHRIAVIEDAAQALSAHYRGRGAGSIGDFGTYSFFPSKNLGGFGDSGMTVTNNDDFAAKARLLRGHGAKPKYFHKIVGGNFRMDPLQAALLAVKLPLLANYTKNRQKNAARYAAELGKIHGVCATPAGGVCSPSAAGGACEPKRCGIALPTPYAHNEHIWNQYTLRIVAGSEWNRPENPRDALQKFLTAREIGSEIYYPRPMHLQECFAIPGQTPEKLPVAESLAAECLSIPVFPELSTEQQGTVIGAIRDFIAENA
jgi:dTDP-4-amino-4,6-dideoxygalactose transaminase